MAKKKETVEEVDAIEVESAPLDVLPELPTEEEMIAEEEALQDVPVEAPTAYVVEEEVVPEEVVEEVVQPEPVKEHDVD